MSLIHDGVDFFLCERGIAEQLSIWFKLVVRGRMKLDPVSTVVDLLPNRLPCGPRIVHSLVIPRQADLRRAQNPLDRKSTRLNSSHSQISYAVFCLKKKNIT